MKTKSKGMSYAKWGYIFLAPFFITFFIFQFWPLATTIYYSFFEYFRSGLKIIGPNFVGLKNYAAMIKEVPKYFSNTMIMWLMGFIPQRIYIGGYHATSHTRCYLAFTGLALICILLSKVIAANHLFRILTTAALMGIAIFFSPIEATNKPLGKKKRLSYKMVASVLSSIDFLFAIFNVLPDTRSITVYYISKWVLVIFAIIPFFQKQAKIS